MAWLGQMRDGQLVDWLMEARTPGFEMHTRKEWVDRLRCVQDEGWQALCQSKVRGHCLSVGMTVEIHDPGHMGGVFIIEDVSPSNISIRPPTGFELSEWRDRRLAEARLAK